MFLNIIYDFLIVSLGYKWFECRNGWKKKRRTEHMHILSEETAHNIIKSKEKKKRTLAVVKKLRMF